MFYEAELRLLRETMRKCRVQTNIVDMNTLTALGQDLRTYFLTPHQVDPISLAQLKQAKPATLYWSTDSINCRYRYLLLPELPQQVLLLIGPYLTTAPTQQQLLEICERNTIAPVNQKQLQQYFNELPVLSDGDHLFALLDSFCQRIWGTNSYRLEVLETTLSDTAPAPKKAPSSEEEDAQWYIKNLERRYGYENEMIEAVYKGQLHKAELFFSSYSHRALEQRVADPVRNAKNYCIIMNTLLRKAAEQGGVHPIYLDSTSSSFAGKIEQLSSLDATPGLMTEMFRAYCRLVRRHSLKNYSPPVQKVITAIDADMSANLTLRHFAQMLNVSGSYLSSLFKKETGQTLTEYINSRRIRHAMHLLETSNLQIQTIAQNCGIVDVQYFSKVFKRIAGCTPKEYRESLKD